MSRHSRGDCYNCGLPGHMARFCPKSIEKTTTKTNIPASSSTASASSHQPRQRKQETASDAKIYIAHLPTDVTEQQVMEKCKPYGDVTTVIFIRKNDRVAGTIENTSVIVYFIDKESATKAINGLDKTKFSTSSTKDLTVKLAKPIGGGRSKFNIRDKDTYKSEERNYYNCTEPRFNLPEVPAGGGGGRGEPSSYRSYNENKSGGGHRNYQKKGGERRRDRSRSPLNRNTPRNRSRSRSRERGGGSHNYYALRQPQYSVLPPPPLSLSLQEISSALSAVSSAVSAANQASPQQQQYQYQQYQQPLQLPLTQLPQHQPQLPQQHQPQQQPQQDPSALLAAATNTFFHFRQQLEQLEKVKQQTQLEMQKRS